eukprot:3616294-Amphidinium_carterae.1
MLISGSWASPLSCVRWKRGGGSAERREQRYLNAPGTWCAVCSFEDGEHRCPMRHWQSVCLESLPLKPRALALGILFCNNVLMSLSTSLDSSLESPTGISWTLIILRSVASRRLRPSNIPLAMANPRMRLRFASMRSQHDVLAVFGCGA